MQSKVKENLDARNFAEICDSLTSMQRRVLCANICADLLVCERSARNWMKGVAKPISISQRKDLVRTIKRSVGIVTDINTLFV